MRWLRRMWHAVAGHPSDQTTWGDVFEGAHCRCGAHWTIADLHL